MKNRSSTVFLSLCLAACAVIIFSGCRKKEPTPKKVVTMNDFFAQEMEMRHCSVSLEEAEKAYVFWVNHDEGMKKFLENKKNNQKKLTGALRAVMEKKEDPKKVYQEHNLHDLGLHEDDWLTCLKEFKSVQQIEELEKTIPDSEKKYLNEVSREEFRRVLEYWLLREYILCVFDLSYPDRKNMDKADKVELLRGMGFHGMGLSLSQTAVWENVVMKVYPAYDFSEFFADRLKKFPGYAAQDRVRMP